MVKCWKMCFWKVEIFLKWKKLKNEVNVSLIFSDFWQLKHWWNFSPQKYFLAMKLADFSSQHTDTVKRKTFWKRESKVILRLREFAYRAFNTIPFLFYTTVRTFLWPRSEILGNSHVASSPHNSWVHGIGLV